MTITLITSGFIGLLLLVLSYQVVRMRVKHQVLIGMGDNVPALENAARAQANLTEYAPTMLILLAALEYMRADHWLLLGLGASFVLGRVLHGFGLGFQAEEYKISKGRQIGTLITWIDLLVASIAALVVGYNF